MHLSSTKVITENDECFVYWNGTTWLLITPNPRLYVGYGDWDYCCMGNAVIYRNVQVPHGSKISGAYLRVCAWEGNPNIKVNSYISAELNPNPQPFTTIADYWARSRTSPPTHWDNIVPFQLDERYFSTNISSHIQQIIDLPTWESGKDICIFWNDHDNRSTHEIARDRAPYAYLVQPPKAMELHITYSLPTEPPPPPVPPYKWSIESIEQIRTDTGYKIIVTTDVPCHLYMRWTTVKPQEHIIPVERRGLYLHSDKYFCFVAWHENEQEEEGDTITHTFIKEPWPICETRYFYFSGTVSGQPSKSTSPIFTKHRAALAWGPPITEDYPALVADGEFRKSLWNPPLPYDFYWEQEDAPVNTDSDNFTPSNTWWGPG